MKNYFAMKILAAYAGYTGDRVLFYTQNRPLTHARGVAGAKGAGASAMRKHRSSSQTAPAAVLLRSHYENSSCLRNEYGGYDHFLYKYQNAKSLPARHCERSVASQAVATKFIAAYAMNMWSRGRFGIDFRYQKPFCLCLAAALQVDAA